MNIFKKRKKTKQDRMIEAISNVIELREKLGVKTVSKTFIYVYEQKKE